MKKNEITNLSDNELLRVYKKRKSDRMINAILIGLFIGISVYSFVKNGLGFWGFFPLLFAFLLFIKKDDFKMIEDEVKSRKFLKNDGDL